MYLQEHQVVLQPGCHHQELHVNLHRRLSYVLMLLKVVLLQSFLFHFH